MKNYLVVKDGFQQVVSADSIHRNMETGQTYFCREEHDAIIAIFPKEAIIVEVDDLTEYQKLLQEAISWLDHVNHNDKEMDLEEYGTLDFWKKQFQRDWLKRFEYLYEKTL